ncbi:hypothetical protein PI124_g14235 [Phytophthora idaei]|nr:hypothetical protein PI124_g14235 [Phytophthora idaei]
MDHELVQRIASHCSAEDAEESTLVGIVVKVLPARDASLIDVAYPTEAKDKAQWQRVQISNGYINVISESLFVELQRQLALAIRASSDH